MSDGLPKSERLFSQYCVWSPDNSQLSISYILRLAQEGAGSSRMALMGVQPDSLNVAAPAMGSAPLGSTGPAVSAGNREGGALGEVSVAATVPGMPAGIVAAEGTRASLKSRWKYVSNDSFVSASGKPWSGVGLRAFTATSRAGVLVWLDWIVKHTPHSLATPPSS